MFKQIFGFTNSSGEIKKVAKLIIKTDENRIIKNLEIIQYDMVVLGHFTLHLTYKNTNPPRYHLQVNNPDFIAPDDRNQFPEILQEFPDHLENQGSIISLQAIPIHLLMDYKNSIYEKINKTSDIKLCQNGIVDYSSVVIDNRSVAMLQFYLVPTNAKKSYEEYKEATKKKLGSRLDLWWQKDDIFPNILAFVFH
jgi:hypothetical protein